MMSNLVEAIEKSYVNKKIADFCIGDTVKVHTKIVEGDKERVQVFNGIVIAKRGIGISKTFTVNRISFGYANEKVFSLHSPNIVNVEIMKRGDVRKAKLNYLRGVLGKKAKVASKIGKKVELHKEEEMEIAEE